MYDRYYIEEKMLDAIKEKVTSEYLLVEEKKQKQRELKEQEERERKRIAAELHDNLGVQANAILHTSSMLSLETHNNKLVAQNLQETAKEMLLNLRETLWAMKTTDVTATDLWLRIINFMKQMGRHYYGIAFKAAGDSPADHIIPSNKALNMVLIVQEAVNNAVKHAGATQITVTCSIATGKWSIVITDNGAGFNIGADPNKRSDSYGLDNMHERAVASALQLSIQSEPGKGTRVLLEA